MSHRHLNSVTILQPNEVDRRINHRKHYLGGHSSSSHIVRRWWWLDSSTLRSRFNTPIPKILAKKNPKIFARARHFQKHTLFDNKTTTYYYLIKILYELLLSINKEALNFKANNIS